VKRGRECIYANNPQVSLVRRRTRRAPRCDPLAHSPAQRSPGSSSQSTAAISPSSYDSSALSHDNSEINIASGYVCPENSPSDVYVPFAWMTSGSTTPSSSPGWDPTILSTAASLPEIPLDPFATEFAAFIISLPAYTDSSLCVDKTKKPMNYMVSDPCYHTSGSCLCHTTLNHDVLEDILSATLANTGQWALPYESTQQMGTMSYPLAPHGTTVIYPMVAGQEVDSKFRVSFHVKNS
jgi:hypothetical protein